PVHAVAGAPPVAGRLGDDPYLVRHDLLVLVRPDRKRDHEQGERDAPADHKDQGKRAHGSVTSSSVLAGSPNELRGNSIPLLCHASAGRSCGSPAGSSTSTSTASSKRRKPL